MEGQNWFCSPAWPSQRSCLPGQCPLCNLDREQVPKILSGLERGHAYALELMLSVQHLAGDGGGRAGALSRKAREVGTWVTLPLFWGSTCGAPPLSPVKDVTPKSLP